MAKIFRSNKLHVTLLSLLIICSSFNEVFGCGKKYKGSKGGKTSNNNNGGNNNNPSSSSAVKNMLGDNVKTNPDDNSGYDAKSGRASGPGDLKCDFEGSCCWKNSKPPYDSMDYVRASGSPDSSKFSSNFGTSTTPSGTYLLTASDNAGGSTDKAEYESCKIPCASGNIQVSLKHWTSNGVKMQVCQVASSDPNSLLGCQDLPTSGPGPDTVSLPPGNDISVVIVSSNFNQKGGNVAIIDDIDVQYQPCSDPTPPPATDGPPPPVEGGTTAPPVSNNGECKKVTCDFENGLCNFNSGTGPGAAALNPGNVKSWETHQGKFMNLATGVPDAPDKSKYAGVYLKPKESAYMESVSNFDTDRVLRFEDYKATQDISLKGCCDKIDSNCGYDTGNEVKRVDYHQWYQGAFMCPKGTTKVIFFAENKGPNEGGVAIDNLQAFQSNGGDPETATTPLCP